MSEHDAFQPDLSGEQVEAASLPRMTTEGFLEEVKARIGDTPLGVGLQQIDYRSDPEGYILPHVMQNLQKLLETAARMTPDPEARARFEDMMTIWQTPAPDAERVTPHTPKEQYEPEPSYRPPYRFVEGPANVVALCKAAGLDPALYANRDFMIEKGLPALTDLFSDGEVQTHRVHELFDPSARKATSEQRYGEFYQKMAQLREKALQEGGAMADEINKLAGFLR